MKVAIAGYDVEGKVSYRYWRNTIGADVTILDERQIDATNLPYGARAFTGADALTELDEFDLVVRTAGMPPRKLAGARRVTSATREFFDTCPAPIIGVTGTKGKGTTASLIASILKADGKTVHLVGNIGVPALEVLPEIQASDIVVYELSSFQLWDIEKSPHVAVILMIEPDHLDVHDNLDDYVAAKARIRKFQQEGDICFYHPTNKYSSRAAFADGAKGTAIRFGIPDESGVYVKSNTFFVQDEAICPIAKMRLAGVHNLENACAAISAARVFGVSNEAVAAGLELFTGLPHRLKFVREVNGVEYYDDSIATTPGSAIAALRSFDAPKVIILGGSDKGASYEEIVEECAKDGTEVIAIGTTGQTIAKLCRARHVNVMELGKVTMPEIVAAAALKASGEGTVILSPASASFDMFENYSDRGDQFVAAVESL